MDRTTLAFICALVSFFILLIFEENVSPYVVVEFLFGTPENEFINFQTITLIFGIMVISTICTETGLFQYLAFKMIQLSKGQSKKVLIVIGVLTFFISTILEDTITAIILIPLMITVCRTLKLPPAPYVISQAIIIKLGATMLPISSVPSIMITTAQEITFWEYFRMAGSISLVTMLFSVGLLLFVFRSELRVDKPEGLAGFLEYDAWVFVKDRKMMLISLSIFISTIIGFIFIPSSAMRPNTIACIGAGILLVFNYRKAGEVLKKIDYQLIGYLLGIFVITGCLEYVGVIDLIGQALNSLGITNLGIAFLVLLWIGAICSAFMDNIPITNLFIALTNVLLGEKGTATAKFGSTGLALGIIWGDNLSPFGDTILVLAIARKNNATITPLEFFKVGLPVTLIQLTGVSMIILLIFSPLVGIIFIGVCGIIGGVIFFILRRRSKKKNKSV